MADGLPSNVICGLSEDSRHDIWISTYMGISRYDINDNRFINYYSGDGLQGNEFTHGAFYKNRNGKIYFGGVNGITSFLPENIGNTSKEAKVWITDFYIFNKPVHKNTLSGGKPVISTSVQDAKISGCLIKIIHSASFSLHCSTIIPSKFLINTKSMN